MEITGAPEPLSHTGRHQPVAALGRRTETSSAEVTSSTSEGVKLPHQNQNCQTGWCWWPQHGHLCCQLGRSWQVAPLCVKSNSQRPTADPQKSTPSRQCRRVMVQHLAKHLKCRTGSRANGLPECNHRNPRVPIACWTAGDRKTTATVPWKENKEEASSSKVTSSTRVKLPGKPELPNRTVLMGHRMATSVCSQLR